MTYTITRSIGIDIGHRIPEHGSRCKNIHGHRILVEATCESAALIDRGEQRGMVLDFGFLKDEMMAEIDTPCDHGLVLCGHDPLLTILSVQDRSSVERDLSVHGWSLGIVPLIGKLYVIPEVPTSENLAKHWFDMLAPRVQTRSNGLARLVRIIAHETPQCRATYEP